MPSPERIALQEGKLRLSPQNRQELMASKEGEGNPIDWTIGKYQDFNKFTRNISGGVAVVSLGTALALPVTAPVALPIAVLGGGMAIVDQVQIKIIDKYKDWRAGGKHRRLQQKENYIRPRPLRRDITLVPNTPVVLPQELKKAA